MSTNTENQGSSNDVAKWGLVILLLAAAVVGNAYFNEVSVLIRAVGFFAIAAALFIAADEGPKRAGIAQAPHEYAKKLANRQRRYSHFDRICGNCLCAVWG